MDTIVKVLGVVALLVAIKAGLSLDLNKWLERREKCARVRLQNYCTHAIPDLQGEALVSSFVSPPATIIWACSKCGYTTDDRNLVLHLLARHGNNPELYWKEEHFQKKAGRFMGMWAPG